MQAAEVIRPAVDLRRDLRVDVTLRTVLVETTMRDENAIIVNISRFGLLARTATVTPVGSRLALDLPLLGPVEADVVWSAMGRTGCQFVKPIDKQLYTAMLDVIPRA